VTSIPYDSIAGKRLAAIRVAETNEASPTTLNEILGPTSSCVQQGLFNMIASQLEAIVKRQAAITVAGVQVRSALDQKLENIAPILCHGNMSQAHGQSVDRTSTLLKIGARIYQLRITVENAADSRQVSFADRRNNLPAKDVQLIDMRFESAPTGESIPSRDVKLSF
jgi:hypothetical protein